MTNLTFNNQSSWTETIWNALHAYREDCIPEGTPEYDNEWSDICTAMAWISEALSINVMLDNTDGDNYGE